MRRYALLAVAISAISLLAIGSGVAQQPDDKSVAPGMGMMRHGMTGPGMMGPGMMDRGGMMGMMGGGCPMMGPMMGMMRGDGDTPAYAEGRIAFLKAELAITDAQQSVWNAYATALRMNLEGMQGMHKTMMGMMQAATPVERLDRHIAAMNARLQSLKDIKPALDGLYSALSDEQKKKADTLLTGMGCMM